MRSTTPEPVGASESSCIHMPFCGWLVSVSNLRSQYQSWLGRSPCSLHHALWLRPLARKSSILSAHNSRSSCLASLVTRISSFPLMTSLSHQRRGARRYGWFDAYSLPLGSPRSTPSNLPPGDGVCPNQSIGTQCSYWPPSSGLCAA